jgi:hypothetical protein
MNSIFDTNLKLFKTSSLQEVLWDNEVADLKLLVLAVLASSQQDLIISTALSSITTDQLREMTEIDIQRDSHDYQGIVYDVETITIRFPQDFYKPQTITFISTEDTSTTYNNSLILIKCFAKLQNLIFHWLKNKHGLIIRSLKFSSEFIIDTLKFTIDGLVNQTRLGDVELQFQTRTLLNALGSITIELRNSDVLQFTKIDQDLLKTLYDYLNIQTSIDFNKLKISRLRCSFIMLTNDGKLKFNRGLPRLAQSEEIKFTMWDFIHKIYETI